MKVPTLREIKEMALKLDAIEVTLTFDGLTAFTILGNLQLALRHPGNQGESREIAIAAARYIQDQLGRVDPEIARHAERGWHTCFDLPRDAQPANEENFPP